MAEHAPLVFQRPRVPLQPRPYSWMTGGLHTFCYTNYGDVLNLSVPSVGGFEIAKVWDEHREAALFFGKPFHTTRKSLIAAAPRGWHWARPPPHVSHLVDYWHGQCQGQPLRNATGCRSQKHRHHAKLLPMQSGGSAQSHGAGAGSSRVVKKRELSAPTSVNNTSAFR